MIRNILKLIIYISLIILIIANINNSNVLGKSLLIVNTIKTVIINNNASVENSSVLDEYENYVSELEEEVSSELEEGNTQIIAIDNISYLSEEESNMINLINQARLENGLTELIVDDNLYTIAEERAIEISQYFSHDRPDGTPFYTISELIDGENLSRYATVDALTTFEGFMNSYNHRNNILHTRYSRVSCFQYIDDIGDIYWIQVFGD